MKSLLKLELFLLIFSISFMFSCEKQKPDEAGILVPKTVDEDSNLPALEVNGTRLHLETFGDPTNPVIIFLHGGPGGDYRILLRLKDTYDNYSLTDEYFCVFYDQGCAGLSRRYGDLKKAKNNEIPELEIEAYIADLHAIVNYFSADRKIILFGHSWGGMLATGYINLYPDKVSAVILSEPGPFTSELYWAFPPGGGIVFFAEGMNDVMWDLQLVSDDMKNHEILDYNLISTFLTMGTDPQHHFDLENDVLKFWRYGAVVSALDPFQDFDFTNNLSQFTTKVLCINSTLQERLSIDFQENNNMVAYSDFEIKKIEDVGHDLIWKKADLHVKYMKEYLDEVLQNN